jgi:membrane-bound metal-dependent hydrolase YbcI (DUF457 family)
MPSPVLHSLAGASLVRLLPNAAATSRGRLLTMLALAAAANAPDLDFVPGVLIGDPGRFHHAATHSVLATFVFGYAVTLIARWNGCRRPVRLGLLLGLAYASHILLDMCSSPVDARHGVPLAWPFGPRMALPVPLFIGIWVDPAAGGFLPGLVHGHNARAVAWELVIAAAAWVASAVWRRTTDRSMT